MGREIEDFSMNGISEPVEAIPSRLEEQGVRTDAAFWPGFLLGLAATSIVVGLIWDISWHISIGRDTFWTPAHMAIYFGGALAGSVGGWLAMRDTFFARRDDSAFSADVWAAGAPGSVGGNLGGDCDADFGSI